jgi:putative peptidoglycan lipid II flippase
MPKSILRSTSLVSVMTLLSRVFGFIRDIVVAHLFGVTAGVDAFFVAFKIPNFMRGLFAEGSFSQAFVPVLSQYRQCNSVPEIRAFISHIFAALSVILIGITLFCVLASPLIVQLFAPGFKVGAARFDLATEMLRITFPYLLLISLAALMGSILNAYHAFGVPSFTPTLLNIVMIVAAVFFAPLFKQPIFGLAWGVLIGGIIQFLFQIPFLYRMGLMPWPVLDWKDSGVQKVLKLMIPALFGASVVQISLLLNTIFASFLPVGSISWLYFSDRLAYFPLGVFGVALSTVILPHLSQKFVKNDHGSFSATVDWGIRCNLVIGLPASFALLWLAGPLVACLFQNGKFTAFDVFMTQKSVMAYSIGLQAFMLVKLLSSAFYARQDIKTPVRVGVVSMICNMLLNAALIIPLAHAGLALATSLAAWINAVVLYLLLYKGKIYQPQSGWGKFLCQMFFANMLLCVFYYFASPNTEVWIAWHLGTRLLRLAFLCGGAFVIYFSSLWLLGIRWRDFRVF